VESFRHTLRGKVLDVHIASRFVDVDVIARSAVRLAAARTGLTDLVTLEGVLAGEQNTREPKIHQVILRGVRHLSIHCLVSLSTFKKG